ncbi:MAG: hypothetical protein ABII00_01110 [Elusimicrobiota bacterium]
MNDLEILRYVVGHRDRHSDPAIRSALIEKGVSLDRIEKAIFEANRLARSARETGEPIDLGEAEAGISWVKRIMLTVVTVVAIAAAIWFVWR